MTDRPAPFADFYAAYLGEHRHPANRALHLLAKVGIVAVVGWAIGAGALTPLLLVPVVAVAPCWLGHLLFEHNRPTAWTRPSASILGSLARLASGASAPAGSRGGRPWYSFTADLVMCAATLRDAWRRLRGVE